MKILVAPQELKGTLRSVEAAQAIAQGLRKSRPELELDLAALADGGPGTVESFLSTARGERKVAKVADPLGRRVEAEWALLEDGGAVIEMAAASGLWRLGPCELDPLACHTLGTGELVRAALEAGARRILVGAGGSATDDGGVGAAMALGVRLLDAEGRPLGPSPRELARLARVDVSGLDPRLRTVPLEVISDVRNPLCGPEGASFVFGPQKGAAAADCQRLDALLARLAAVVSAQLGGRWHEAPGSGAGGGFAFGLAALCGASLGPGFETVAAALGLAGRVGRADLVVTAEGRLDEQSAYSKGPFALARLARAQGKTVVLFAGAIGDARAATVAAFDEVVVVTPAGTSQEQLLPRAFELLEAAAARWAEGRVPAAWR